MSQGRYTLLIIPEDNRQVWRLNIKRRWLSVGMMLALVLAVLAGGVMYDYGRLLVNRSELGQLRKAAVWHDDRMQQALDEIDNLRHQLVMLGHNDAKLRVMAELDPPHAKGLSGTGGSQELEAPPNIDEIQYQIDQLRARIDLQRTSQEEIHGILSDQRSLVAATPAGWPAKGWVTSRFGPRKDPFTGRRKFHYGFDIAARTGTPVYATADGVVSHVQISSSYGKVIIIDHGYGFQTRYAHNSRVFVKVGDRVTRHQKISAIGNTGRSTGPHLHYEILVDGIPVSPKKYL